MLRLFYVICISAIMIGCGGGGSGSYFPTGTDLDGEYDSDFGIFSVDTASSTTKIASVVTERTETTRPSAKELSKKLRHRELDIDYTEEGVDVVYVSQQDVFFLVGYANVTDDSKAKASRDDLEVEEELDPGVYLVIAAFEENGELAEDFADNGVLYHECQPANYATAVGSDLPEAFWVSVVAYNGDGDDDYLFLALEGAEGDTDDYFFNHVYRMSIDENPVVIDEEITDSTGDPNTMDIVTTAITMDSLDRVIVASYGGEDTTYLTAFDIDLDIDRHYGEYGTVRFQNFTDCWAIAGDDDGDVYLAGAWENDEASLMSVNALGGINGNPWIGPEGDHCEYFNDLVIDGNRIYATGPVVASGGEGGGGRDLLHGSVYVACFTHDCKLNTSFGIDGTVYVPTPTHPIEDEIEMEPYGIEINSAGGPVITGEYVYVDNITGSQYYGFAVQLDEDGEFDETFSEDDGDGLDGYFTRSNMLGAGSNEDAFNRGVIRGGKMWVAGISEDPDTGDEDTSDIIMIRID